MMLIMCPLHSLWYFKNNISALLRFDHCGETKEDWAANCLITGPFISIFMCIQTIVTACKIDVYIGNQSFKNHNLFGYTFAYISAIWGKGGNVYYMELFISKRMQRSCGRYVCDLGLSLVIFYALTTKVCFRRNNKVIKICTNVKFLWPSDFRYY